MTSRWIRLYLRLALYCGTRSSPSKKKSHDFVRFTVERKVLGGGGRDRNCRVKGLEQRRQILIRLNQAKKKHVKTKGLECIMSNCVWIFAPILYSLSTLQLYSLCNFFVWDRTINHKHCLIRFYVLEMEINAKKMDFYAGIYLSDVHNV